MTDRRPQPVAPGVASQHGPRALRVQSTDGHCNVFDSAALDANYVARHRPDGSLEVAIVVTDSSGELKEFIVRRYAHNEVRLLEQLEQA